MTAGALSQTRLLSKHSFVQRPPNTPNLQNRYVIFLVLLLCSSVFQMGQPSDIVLGKKRQHQQKTILLEADPYKIDTRCRKGLFEHTLCTAQQIVTSIQNRPHDVTHKWAFDKCVVFSDAVVQEMPSLTCIR